MFQHLNIRVTFARISFIWFVIICASLSVDERDLRFGEHPEYPLSNEMDFGGDEDFEAIFAAVDQAEREYARSLAGDRIVPPPALPMQLDLEEDQVLIFSDDDEAQQEPQLKKKRLKKRVEENPDDPAFEVYLDDDLFSDEASDEKKTPKKKRLKRKENTSPGTQSTSASKKGRGLPKYTINKFLGIPEEEKRPKFISAGVTDFKEESDDEGEEEGICTYSRAPIRELESAIDMGMKLKLLANVYLGRIDQSANIFLPQYVLDLEGEGGSVTRSTPAFFRTAKGEICVFASGSSHNVWEKTVARVYEIFFGEKVKIIRAWWMQRHLYSEKKISRRLTEEFKGRENELHSEFYYDLFFKHFFLPGLIEEYGDSVKAMTVNAFTWWEVCDSCHINYLEQHRQLCTEQGIKGPYFNLGAARRYQHHYPEAPTLVGYRVPSDQEETAWRVIWEGLKSYVDLHADDEEEKRKFWTKTANGIELCKWIGQAFVENAHSLKGRKSVPKRGDILRFYNEMIEQGEEGAKDLKNLILYLRERNYEFSCWYKIPYVEKIQGNWKKYASQIIMPHFHWKLLGEFEVEFGDSQCDMCGNEDVRYMSMVYHSKHRVSKNIATTAEEEYVDWPFDTEIRFDQLTEAQKKERRQSIAVGSECVKFLRLGRTEIDEWRQEHPLEELEYKLDALDQRQAQNDATDVGEAMILLNWMREESIDGTSPLKRRDILKNSDWGLAKHLNPLLDILLRKKKIEEVEKGSYVIRKRRK